jgi:hypothetical protein
LRPEVFRDPRRDDAPARFREPLRVRPPPDDRRDGTLAPLRRDSFRPIAIACFRLRTVRPDPLFRVPRLRRRIVERTFFDADFPYFAMESSWRKRCKRCA